MPGVYDYNTVEDAWRNGSVMDMVNNQVAQPTQTAPQPTPQSTEGIVQPSVQNLQQPNNSVFNQTHQAENPQPVPTQPATQVVSQGMNYRPTVDEYTARAIGYLRDKGYSYEDAMQLMQPRIAMYKAEQDAYNRNAADDLVGRMQSMDIASPEYRQAAFQLYRLDPKLGQFMLKEGIGPRELYQQNQKREDAATARQQKREDMVFNNDLQFQGRLRWLKAQNEFTQQQYANKAQQLMDVYGYGPKEAWGIVLGGGKGKTSAGYAGVSKDDYKRATEGLKALDDEIAEGRLTNPNFQLSPEKQRQWNMFYAVKQKGDDEFFARNGVGQQQQQPQRVKVDPSDYRSVGPFIQWAVEQNGGKFTPDLARAIRAKLGFNPDDNSPNNFVNQIFQTHYDYGG